MKLDNIKKSAILHSLILVILCAALTVLIWFNFHLLKRHKASEEEAKTEVTRIENEVTNLNNKSKDLAKYLEDPTLADELKASKAGSAKMSEIKNMIKPIAITYGIKIEGFKTSVPQNIGKLLQVNAIEVTYLGGSIKYKALDDIRAIAFLSDLAKKFPGYFVIVNVELKKGEEYKEKDYIEISRGKIADSMAISAKADFIWYMSARGKQIPTTTPKKS